MINITINCLTCRLRADPKLMVKVKRFLSFKHPDARFIRDSLRYEWDGMIYPMNDRGVFPSGFLPKVIEFLIEISDGFEEELALVDNRNIPEVGVIPKKVGKFELYYHQRLAIESIVYSSLYGIPWPQGFVSAGMGAGKTLTMFGLYMAFDRPKTVILVDNSQLFEQHKKDLRETFPDEYGYLRGKKEDKGGNIRLCMVKTLANRIQEDKYFVSGVSMVLVDEADLAGSKTFKKVLSAFTEASVRVGFSGTIFKRELKKDILRNSTLRGRFGEILYDIPATELEDKGITSKAIIKLIPGVTGLTGGSFKEEFDLVIGNNEDHYKIVADRLKFNLLTHKHPIMVFTRYIKQTELLGGYLRKNFPDVKVDVVHHKNVTEDVLKNFTEGRTKVLVCSLFLKRGLSFPLVRCIINASAGEFYSNPLQILGRGTRTKGGKKMKFYFEDIMDDGKYLGRHSKQRHIHYKREGYTIRDLRK